MWKVLGGSKETEVEVLGRPWKVKTSFGLQFKRSRMIDKLLDNLALFQESKLRQTCLSTADINLSRFLPQQHSIAIVSFIIVDPLHPLIKRKLPKKSYWHRQ